MTPMEPTFIKRSEDAYRVILWIIGIASTLIALFAAFLIGSMFTIASGGHGFSRILTFLLIMGFAGLAAMIYHIKWHAVIYILRPEGIIVGNSVGAFGKKQKVYLYESIISASVNQNYFGNKYGYGDIHVTIPKLEKKLILKDVEIPDKQLEYLYARIKAKAGAHNVLVT